MIKSYDLFIISITFTSILILLVFLLVKLTLAGIMENRIKHFTYDAVKEDDVSLIDIILESMYKIVKIISGFLSKANLLKKYGNYFEKYLIYQNDNKYKGIDYVSLKLIIMFFTDLLYIISNLIKYVKFNILLFIVVSIFGFFILDIIIIILFKNKQKLIEEQLLQGVVIMNSAFKSGKNILEAIDIVIKELPSPIKEEFKIISKDLSYGLDVGSAFKRFSNRVRVEGADYITASLSLLSKTGGNIVTVFNMIENNFYDRLKIKNELQALTASSKFLFRTLIILPFVFVLVIVALNPDYFTPMINTKMGFLIDMVILVIYTLYIIIIRKITRVDKV